MPWVGATQQRPGALVLEHPDGTPDPIPTPELVGLLRPARRQLKLVTLSSCQSAAAPTVEVRRWLGLPVPDQLQQTVEPSVPPLPALAQELVRSLDCAVVAMRYPVVDDFAIALSGQGASPDGGTERYGHASDCRCHPPRCRS